MKQKLTVTLQLIVNGVKRNWTEFCYTYPDEAYEILQRMNDIREGLNEIVFESGEEEEEQPQPKPSRRKLKNYHEKILHLIARTEGVTTEELMKLTRSDKKRVWNIIYFLRAKKGYQIQKIGDRYHLVM